MDTKKLVLRYYDEVWRDGNVDAIDELLAPDHVDETPPPGFDGTRDAQKQIAVMMRDSSTDKTIEVLDVVVDGDRAAGVWRMAWTQIGDLWGMIPADGKRIELEGIDYFQVRDGRISRTRHVENWIAVALKLGAFGNQ
jgi:ketosteroid isomerase-like protein